MCVVCLSQQQQIRKKKKKRSMKQAVYSPSQTTTHAMLVEPQRSAADIHHGMLPSLVWPFARLMRWSTSMNYTWETVRI